MRFVRASANDILAPAAGSTNPAKIFNQISSSMQRDSKLGWLNKYSIKN